MRFLYIQRTWNKMQGIFISEKVNQRKEEDSGGWQ